MQNLKYFFLFAIAFLASPAFSCVCEQPLFMDRYIGSEFVARVKITENYNNVGDQLYYKSDIVIMELFKGRKVKSLLIEGNSDGKARTSCDIFIPKNTELLVYARSDGNGNYIFGSCSGYLILDHTRPKTEKREFEMLHFLQDRKITYTDPIRYNVSLYHELESLKGYELDKSYAIYELTFTSDMKVDSISTLTGFTPEIDKKITAILQTRRWVSTRVENGGIVRNSVPAGSKLLVGLYYYPADKGYASFIGQWDF